ncbi:MAG: glycosyltransferase [Cyanobacteria bacterium P01_G01_bin.39]
MKPKFSLRVAFVVGRFPVLSESFILNQISGLIERGHKVDIYALEGYSAETKVHPIVEQYSLINFAYYVPKIPQNYGLRFLKALQLFLIKGWRNFPAIWRSLNIVKYGKQAASLRLFYSAIAFLEQNDYDIVHCQFGIYALQGKLPSDPGIVALRSLGLLKGKLVVAFRGWDISWYVKEQGEQVYDELFKVADFFVTNCNFFRDRAIKIGCPGAKIVVNGSGLDCQKFSYKPRHFPESGLIRLVTIGRLVEKKGIEYGIRAVAQLILDYPHLEYKIIGDGYLRDQLQQLIVELDLADKIELLGWQQQPEIISILDSSHIFIAPCVTAKDGNQDAPVNTLKEAMAMGLPVVSTVHGGIPELVQDGVSGYLVPERDAKAIAEKLHFLISNPDLWQEMGWAGRKFVEQNYDMNRLNDELAQIYAQLILK